MPDGLKTAVASKKFKAHLIKDERVVVLYITTTDEAIDKDLAYGGGYSLTLIGRNENQRNHPTQETDHLDFATGAFLTATHTNIATLCGKIVEVDAIPDGGTAHPLGGKGGQPVTCVYEVAT
jgi:hypothetical protein